MYVAVQGGQRAIENSRTLLAEERRGDPAVPEITLAQIDEQLSLAVDRVMAEGALYDRALAALAVKQARGDIIEAIFLLRAYRTTLPRLGYAEAIDTARMAVRRRISATYKDLPGGQVLGPTFDYTLRLLDFDLAESGSLPAAEEAPEPLTGSMPRVADILGHDGLIEPEDADDAREVGDLTRDPITFPADRDVRLQALRAATRASCCRSVIRHSAATARTTPSPARSAWARSPSNSCRRSWASPSRSPRSPSPNARW